MHWDGYTIFSLITGIVLLGAALAPGLAAKDRFWAVVAGLLIGGYGIYVAKQTSGTYYFSIWIFVVPFAALAYVALQASAARRRAASPTTTPRAADAPSAPDGRD